MNYSQHMADMAAQKLIDAGATNYVGEVFTITVGEEEKFEVLVTTQKVGAKTPMQRFTEAKELLELIDNTLNTFDEIRPDSHVHGLIKEFLE